ncbi:hypothetical protein JHK85_057886 [Glycine max]|uniref:RING-type domain-containing protein n=1 Tax=Glycine max TaxID=3847 RepID=A0A0R0EE58_SOYBN|nr:hypothetical protein JHK86_056865 [Glycine max]KAG4919605.1 hypothetical protein JHK85_057886 [Glycine max]
MHHAGYIQTDIKTITMTIGAAKLNYEKVSACVACPLCNKFFRNATTISECCHSFCRECIDKKLIDEKLKHCPICNRDLGCSPLDKLRSDPCLQDLRDKIFPFEEQNASVKLNIYRKKNSLSSLKKNAKIDKAASKPDKAEDENRGEVEVLEEASSSTIGSARRAKAAARLKFTCSAPPAACQLDKVAGEDKKDGGHPRGGETSNGSLKIKIPQNSSKANSSQQSDTNKRDNSEFRNETADMLEPLNSLVEPGSKKSRKKSTMRSNDNAADQNESTPSNSDSVQHQRPLSNQEKTLRISEDLNFPAQPEIGSNIEGNKEFGPIWFCLVAAEEKKASARLPQLYSSYLRVKDGSVTVSYIKKYLVKKLGLASEDEVEITLQGRALLSSLQLRNLVDMWLHTVPKNKIQTFVGSSAKDFIMALSYGRKT